MTDTAIDWDLFGDRVKAGARVVIRSYLWIQNPSDGPVYKSLRDEEGILIRHGYERYGNKTGAVQWCNDPYIQLFKYPRPRGICPIDLKYLIDGRWLTFAQVMA